jgi:recombination protein RecA
MAKKKVCEPVEEPKDKKDKKSKKKVEAEAQDVIDSKMAFELTAKKSADKFKNSFHAWLYEKDKLKQERFSSGCLGLDTALGGEGLPEGRIIEIWGPPSSGKTSLGLEIAWHRQQQGLKRRAAGDLSAPIGILFIDAEHKFDRRLLANWRGGFDPEATFFAEPQSGEDAFGIMFSFAESAGTAMIMLDSISALRPSELLLKEDQTTHYGAQANFIADWLPKLAGAAARTGVPMVLINQVRANLKAGQFSFGMNAYNKGGGFALKHGVSVSIFFDLITKGYLESTKDSSGKSVKPESKFKGQWSRGSIFRNHSGDTFFDKFKVFLEYGKRFLTAGELLELGTDLSVIQKGGGGNYTVYDHHVRGKENVTEYIDTHPEVLQRLWDDVKTMQLIGRTPIVDVNDMEEVESGENLNGE